jgi:leucyl/phenylalanyl-tRNA--protein transferase
MFILPTNIDDLRFPPVDLASPEGLLAIGGDLRCARLLEAYRHGIFPWYNEGQPILWWSPDPRAVLLPKKLKISRSLRKSLRNKTYTVRMDTEFREVIEACSRPRKNHPDSGTWITREMISAYCELYQQGWAHSIEVWHNKKIVGGLYGVAMGGAFFGESMFSTVTDASKIALIYLTRQLQNWGFRFIDCQLPSAHLMSLGAERIRRSDFIDMLEEALQLPDYQGHWRLDPDLASTTI